MAKSKSFFGLRRGSTKTLTFQVNNGKQITKDRVYEVKNPRTQEQMVQRMVMATASAAYAGMKQIVDHSFEGITYGQMNMSEFIRLNAKKLRENLGAANPTMCYNKYQNRNIVPGAYIMSRGSAPDFKARPLVGSGIGEHEGKAKVTLEVANGTTLSTNALSEKYGLGLNELMTICGLHWNSSASKWEFFFVRYQILQLSADAITSENLDTMLKIESNVEFTTNVTGVSVIAYTQATDTDDAGVASCVIHSIKTADGWTRNNADMRTINVSPQFLNPTEDEAIATYPVGGSYVLNGGEVNG